MSRLMNEEIQKAEPGEINLNEATSSFAVQQLSELFRDVRKEECQQFETLLECNMNMQLNEVYSNYLNYLEYYFAFI